MKVSKLFLCIILLLCVLFSSCFDYMYHFTVKNDTLFIYQRITVMKSLFESSENADEMIDKMKKSFSEVKEKMQSVYPPEIKLETVDIDNEFEIGLDLIVSYDHKNAILAKTIKDKKIPLLPIISSNTIEILLSNTNKINFFGDDKETDSDSDTEYDNSEITQKMRNLILASVKLRISISKQLLPTVKNTYLIVNTIRKPITFTDMHDIYVYDIPFLFIAEEKDIISLVLEL